ncbi:MAG: ParB N-terminal domain-containing protein [Spirochaetaceae bacterium]|nr:ParB N-terminal domain-containing protein [Spirochaetaceae bacterium]MDT8297985.1 ParB N-terminal domain-containing protein [Spirochaetaceae bacterium]
MIDIQEIPPDKIDTSSPNIRSVMDETGSLAESMESHGQLEPGTGWWEGDRFHIATGHRRAEACRHLNIPFLARIIEPLSGSDLIEFQLVENIQAEALMAEDLENAVGTLMETYGSASEVGKRLGKSAGWISTVVSAGKARESLIELNRPEAPQQPVHDLSTSTASQFAQLKDEDNRKAAYEEALRRSKSEKQLSPHVVKDVVEEFKEREIRDVPAYVHKLKVTRAKLVQKRADIEAEIDRIDAKIAELTERDRP